MLSPYNDQEESDNSSVTSTESGETTGTSVDERLKQDGRMQALDQWRNHTLSWIDGPGRAPVGEGPGLPPVSGVGLQNTALQITEQRVTHTLMVDSLDRDQRIYPLPTQFKLRLPRTYRNVARIDIVQIKMLSGFYALTAAKGNTSFTIEDSSSGTYTVSLNDGTYTIQQLIDSIVLPVGYSMTYNCTTGRITITGPSAFTILPPTSPALPAKLPSSDWGLAWNLGFGGPAAPVAAILADCSGSVCYCATATCFPRLTTDYIYLRLNETEFMNSVDHTDLEDTEVSQDPTGQISHYFAKLLLNDFGCYAQTMIESPKIFAPVLGRLDRLSFTWVDRAGRPLVGPDATSCDWHMTLRIVEIQDRASAASTLVRAPQPS
jgi:hypothetical protein